MRTVGGEVELAYDEGFIVAGGRRLAVAELEIELVRGRPEAVVDVAQRWASRHHLWIDTRSKAERGERLATGAARGPAATAGTVVLDDGMTPSVALQAVIEACLTQVLRNASEVASGEFDDEHVHQLRVGLRRVRSALRLFEGWASGVDPGWPHAAAMAFRHLGATRDRGALRGSLLPRLRDAGAPVFDPFPPIQPPCGSDVPGSATTVPAAGAPVAVAPPGSGPDDPVEIVRSRAFTTLALQLQRFVVRTAPLPAAGDPELRTLLQGRLDDWHRQVMRDACRFADLADERRHRLRKRLKRLRYAVEFVAALYPRKAVDRYLELLAPAQDRLGGYNDVCVALDLFTEVVAADPRAWFAVGWLNATRGDMIPRIADELKQLRAMRPFWA
jgi:inorganic triphosphatase YgiF